MREAEARDEGREHPERDGQPERAVPQHEVRPADEPRVPLGGRPEAGHRADRGAAERVGERRQRAVGQPVGEIAREDAEDEQHDPAQVGRQRLPRERRGGEHAAADQDQVGEQHQDVRLHVRGGQHGAELPLRHVRHHRPEQQAERDAEEQHRVHHGGAEEAPTT
jgi:hypothetical protein